MFKFEKLIVWQNAIAFVDLIHPETASFPIDERFGLTNQIRRATVSVPSNVAEGSASGSLYEVVTQALIARRRQYLAEPNLDPICGDADEISRMLSGLRDFLGD